MPINIRDAFTDYLRQHIGLKDVQITTWERIADGWETDVYAYQVVTPQHSEDKILRIFMGDSLGKARREYYGMSALDYLAYPVPQVSHLCEDARVVGGPFILMERIFGQPIGRVMHQDDALFERFIGLLVELHQLPPVPLHEVLPEVTPVTSLPDFWLTKLAWARQIALDQFRQTWAAPLLDWLDANPPHFPPDARPATLHNDYHPYNVLLTDEGDLRVIDWPNIEVGDFRYDLAWTILLMTTYTQSPDMRERILADYGRQAGQRVIDIEIFEVIAAARRLMDLVMTLGVGAAAMGLRPETVATMRGQVGHFRRVYEVLHSRSGLSLPMIEKLLADLENQDNRPS